MRRETERAIERWAWPKKCALGCYAQAFIQFPPSGTVNVFVRV